MPDLHQLYTDCCLCPRQCRVDRTAGKTGFCGAGTEVKIAFAGLHKGEEPPISGENGSGTVFFTGCTLQCPACQNFQISAGDLGRALGTEELADLFLALERRGAHNLNLVTATHHLPAVANALTVARRRGSSVPVVWNSSGYESPEILPHLHQFVDIFLPDIKTLDANLARELFGRPDYPEAARASLSAMAAAKPLLWDGDRLRQGTLVRHLVLPGRLESTRECLAWFAENLAGRALLSLMFQYIPLQKGARTDGRKADAREYEKVMGWLDDFGITDGFIQDLPESDAWIPDFTRSNPFPRDCAVPVWHCRYGFLRENCHRGTEITEK